MVHVGVGLMNIAELFLSNLDVLYVLTIYRLPTKSHVQDENLLFYLSEFSVGKGSDYHWEF